ncbi:hypothetical protein KIN20_013600 [Parelaphostrongylus tenuis]|uniref:Histone-lysine N-methyltransferase SETMAR n=1 Tax=Parelaphostrongylus tenuis TaxID=148309 RepID=A0AAD5N290_PARTN|nr:hypothetical protein KIN20_013600 [Parelaphostrongylus tenuis]
MGAEVLPHLAYSPHAAPSDYRFICLAEQFLRERRCDTFDQVEEKAVAEWL